MKLNIYSLSLLSNILMVAAANHPLLHYNLIEGLSDIFLDPAAETIGHTWCRGSVYEKHLIQKFYALIPTDKPCIVFDLGAQTGAFSLMAKFLPFSTWYAFEPIKEAADILKSNLTLNDIHNVAVHQVAVTDFNGTTTLTLPDRANWGLSTLGAHPLRFRPQMQRSVQCITLDAFVEFHGIQRVHFMKLDTEGSELAILRGAQKMIARDHPIMIIEYNETNMKQCNVLRKELDDFLTDMGYTWQLVSGEDILCIPIVS